MKNKIKYSIIYIAVCVSIFMFFGFLKSYKWENKNFTPSMKDTMIQSIENNSPVRCEKEKTNFRKPKNNSELKYWLENMVYYHHFTNYEIHEATGLSNDEILKALKNFHIDEQHQPKRPADAPLLLLPYPGGRHPRIGFLEGAIRPQRETKISVFTPWDPKSYVVVDIPEAIWSNLGLTYLAHTHVPTIWSQKNIELKKLEWTRKLNGELILERRLPNGIIFGTKVIPHKNNVEMEMWLKNATKDTLSGLRVQNCVMLKNAIDFNEQTDSNKVFDKPYAATRSKDGKRWIITAWKPCDRTWGNNLVPCMHSDPKFPDCPPGQTRRLKGWLSFYEGSDIETEFKRIDEAGWNNN